ncbi:hypothetical protein GCM10010124_28960 [Pilimelia terevasa]|uniref:Non-specific serine/threonine protein kinase n=1 Tax=Pilimelia terevasa TaxID=53372 RepID=A0A8J3FJ07_9ACTN|nr:protein kinase [Pilimelia terevasa]GGK34531.1 hypothetical protein GCM10010124_28960 [Pilimelia terevasa]
MLAERWTAVTPSEHPHEREALSQLADCIPDTEPYRMWTNFTFIATSGVLCEVDALVIGPGGLYLVEAKSYIGGLRRRGNGWEQFGGGPPRGRGNALIEADVKAKRLKGLLESEAKRLGFPVPYVKAAVYFSKPRLKVELPDADRLALYGLPEGLGDIGALLTAPPRHPRAEVTAGRSRKLVEVLGQVGIAQSARYYQVGNWTMTRTPLGEGKTWQDYLATHREVPGTHRRIRLYLVERTAREPERLSIARAARREMAALRDIRHPGIVQVDTLEEHEVGPALVYRYDPRSMRLPDYLAEYGERLDPLVRVNLIRQLAEALAYAHGRRLYHRALSAECVLVLPADRRTGHTDADAWLHPRLEIIDWNMASRAREAADDLAVSATVHAGMHLSTQDGVYLAPEWEQPGAEPVALDVFGAGALAYALLTGQPPAEDAMGLWRRLEAEQGLLPSALFSDVSPHADDLIQSATVPAPARRLPTMDAFLDRLGDLERHLAEAAQVAADGPDPLEAVPGDRVGAWLVEEVLGIGSTSQGLLATHDDGARHVLKVALSEARRPRLEQEAAVLRRLRNDSRVICLVRPDVLTLSGRSVLAFEYLGADTLATRLRGPDRLAPDELESYGDQLLDVVAFLEGEQVFHRDLKPANIVVRTRPNGTRAPVLFDFSLAGVSDSELHAGTPGYRDPFLGAAGRPVYDAAAERYALAVTLHEMASGRLPVWGDGRTEPRFTEGPPVLAAAEFPAALRAGLSAFFLRALDRDAAARYRSVRDLRLAWGDVFRRPASRPAPAAPAHPAAPPTPAAPRSAAAPPPLAAPAAAPAPAPAAALPPAVVAKATVAKSTAPHRPSAVPPTPSNEYLVARARDVVRAALAEHGPLNLGKVAQVLGETLPALRESWAGAGRFRQFVVQHLGEFTFTPGTVEGGFLSDPAAPAPVPAAPAPVSVAAPPPPGGGALPADLVRAREVLDRELAAQCPLPPATAAQRLRDAVPRLIPDWAGAGRFGVFMTTFMADYPYRPDPDGCVLRPGMSLASRPARTPAPGTPPAPHAPAGSPAAKPAKAAAPPSATPARKPAGPAAPAAPAAASGGTAAPRPLPAAAPKTSLPKVAPPKAAPPKAAAPKAAKTHSPQQPAAPPKPNTPKPTAPKPAASKPAASKPAASKSAAPKPAAAKPGQPKSAPATAAASPAQPNVVQKSPQPTPAKPAPAKPAQTKPAQAKPAQTKPAKGVAAARPVPKPPQLSRSEMVARARAALLPALEERGTLRLTEAAVIIRNAVPGIEGNWAGAEKFSAFVRIHFADFPQRLDPPAEIAAPGRPGPWGWLSVLRRAVRGEDPR